jgi:Acetyltransferase (GNAT) domain
MAPSPPLEIRVLDVRDPRACAAWTRLWQDWPDREVMAHPDYVRLFARPCDLVLAATARTDRGGILYPFVLRPLEAEPWVSPGEAGWDLTSPYGYGGPYAWNIGPEEARAFWTQFDTWTRTRPVVTSFVRLSVFPDQLLPFDGEVVVNSPNVIRDLQRSDDGLWNDYESKVRQNVRRARARGCTVEVDPEGARLDDFHRVYTATMERRHASRYYFFSRAFFEALRQSLPGQFVFFHVFHDQRVVSSELVLLSQRHAYFFLGGTLVEAFGLRPNDLLQHETFRWCRDAGKTALVLGGGYRGSEGLLRYKRSFAPHGDVPFRVGTRIHDPARALRLVEERGRWEAARGIDWQPDPTFFPAYRSG